MLTCAKDLSVNPALLKKSFTELLEQVRSESEAMSETTRQFVVGVRHFLFFGSSGFGQPLAVIFARVDKRLSR